jgi:hypothetical protein
VPVDQRVAVAPTAVAAAEAAGDGGDGGGAAAAADNPYGVPAHLLERSRRARERLAAG